MSNQVLSMYENIAGLTNQMVVAARANDWTSLNHLENECAVESVAAIGGAAPLQGDARARKIALLKQIMANDRAIRDVTDPWMAKLNG